MTANFARQLALNKLLGYSDVRYPLKKLRLFGQIQKMRIKTNFVWVNESNKQTGKSADIEEWWTKAQRLSRLATHGLRWCYPMIQWIIHRL